MGITTVRPLNLVIQDNDEKISIAITAENFRKINEAFSEYSTKGFLDAEYVAGLDKIEESGVYYYNNGSTNIYIVRASFVTTSPRDKYILLEQIDIITGAKNIYVKSVADNTVSYLHTPNPTMSRYGLTPGGYYYSATTDQFWMGRRLYTALLPFTFVSGTGLTFKGIKGHVVRYEGILKGEFTSMGSLGGVVKQITLPYICTPFDNQRSAWLTFTSRGDENEIYMFMHGANSDVENAEGFVQIWYYDPNEESV